MRLRKNNCGEVMVEAAIYFPFVLMVVFFILVLSIAQLNQYIINYQVARVADLSSAANNYYSFDTTLSPSFAAGMTESELPSEAAVIDYYEFKQLNGSWYSNTTGFSDELEAALNKYSLVKGVVKTSPVITVDRGYTDIINISVEYDLNMPGFISYITGTEKKVVAVSGTSTSTFRAADTIRRYDAMDNQIYNYYGGECFITDTTRYSDFEFDNNTNYFNRKYYGLY